jgi:hypothetical protein
MERAGQTDKRHEKIRLEWRKQGREREEDAGEGQGMTWRRGHLKVDRRLAPTICQQGCPGRARGRFSVLP